MQQPISWTGTTRHLVLPVRQRRVSFLTWVNVVLGIITMTALIIATRTTMLHVPPPEPKLSAGTIYPTPEKGCQAQVGLIEQLVLQGQWERARDAANTALSASPQPQCSAYLHELRGKARLELLLASTVIPEDSARQNALASNYRVLRAEGHSLHLSDLQIARRAYDANLFPLALAAFEQALSMRSVPLGDRALMQQYASTMHNVAFWQLQASPNPSAEAVRLLVTSVCINASYGIPSDASLGLLYAVAGPDISTWPRPMETQVITSATYPNSCSS